MSTPDASENAYYTVDDDSKHLAGPRKFDCYIGEPEDATWSRDLSPAWDRLDELERELNAANKEIERMRKIEAAALECVAQYGRIPLTQSASRTALIDMILSDLKNTITKPKIND